MSDELKPCPFCGSKARSSRWELDGKEKWEVWCSDDEGCICPGDADYISRDECLESWNTRPIEDALIAEIERLRGELGTPSDDYWDAHAYHCGNCDRALLTRGGRSKSVSPLSDPGQSEDEALCGSCAGADLYHVEAELDAALRENEIFAASRKEAMETVEALRAELIAALEEIAGTPPESLWQMQDSRIKYIEIQVDKKDYEAARKRLAELKNG